MPDAESVSSSSGHLLHVRDSRATQRSPCAFLSPLQLSRHADGASQRRPALVLRATAERQHQNDCIKYTFNKGSNSHLFNRSSPRFFYYITKRWSFQPDSGRYSTASWPQQRKNLILSSTSGVEIAILLTGTYQSDCGHAHSEANFQGFRGEIVH